jgi:ribonuclease J
LKDTTLKPAQELLFCALGGSGEIGMNVNLYGCDGKWLMADLGMTFSGNEYPGIDLVFADLEFIEQRRKDLLGIVLTHAHEDHIGAVPYFAADLGVPLYATPFTAKLVAAKLDEAGLLDTVELIEIDHLDRFAIGPFGIRYVPLAHSIAEGNALLIDTPYGKIFHTGDWKLDEEPLIGQPATPDELRRIGDEGVLALVCDSTNVFNPEPSGSEGDVARGLAEEVARHKGKRVLVTTFASNVARLHTLGQVAKQTNRQLCVSGRSLDRIIASAKACGYLDKLPDLIDVDRAMDLPRGEVLIVATGGQGSRARRWPASRTATIRSSWSRAMSCSSPAVRSPAMKSPSAASRTSWPRRASRSSPTARATSTSRATPVARNWKSSMAGCVPKSSSPFMAKCATCASRAGWARPPGSAISSIR